MKKNEPGPRPAPSATVVNGLGGRTPAGTFTAGNRFGRGNTFNRRLGQMRSAFLNAVTEEDVALVAKKICDLAKSGDLAAAGLFLQCAAGKPANPVEPDAENVETMDEAVQRVLNEAKRGCDDDRD